MGVNVANKISIMPTTPRCGCSEASADLFGVVSIATTSVPLRQAWFRRYGHSAGYRPPLVSLLEPPGRGGADTRLGLWLWLYLEACRRVELGGPPILRVRRREFAARLHLLEANEFGNDRVRDSRARRVDNALRHLRERHLVVARSRGEVELCDHLGSGRPFEPESESARDERRRRLKKLVFWRLPTGRNEIGKAVKRTHRPADPAAVRRSRRLDDGRWLGDEWEGDAIRLPLDLWANGWVSALPARALLALFVLLDEHQIQGTEWFRVPRVLQSQFTLGPDVWHGGLARLVDEGIVAERTQGTQGFVNRKEFRLHLDVIHAQSRCPGGS